MKHLRYIRMSGSPDLVNLMDNKPYLDFLMAMKSRIPNPAYLVIGSCPSEERKGRTYYDNPAYYLYDMVDVPAGTDKSRYIQANMTIGPINHQLSNKKLFGEKFDTVIMDNAVAKFLEGNVGTIPFMFDMVKPGGTFIIDSVYGVSAFFRKPEEELEEHKARKKEEFLSGIRENIKNRATLEVTTFGELITKNPIANEVYGPLLADPAFIPIYQIRPEGECIVIKKAASGGRRRRRGNKKSRRHKLRHSRRTRRKT